jgi:two-component system, chemotaxis family, sensor kinase CheA
MNEVLREFLLETHENLAQIDLDLVTLEKDPTERETLARVFRTLHTVKGTAGFLGFPRLQNVAHAGENLLSRLRDGHLRFNAEIAGALLGVVDAIRRVLASIEQSEKEGDSDFSALIRSLEQLRNGAAGTASAAAPRTPSPPAADVTMLGAVSAAAPPAPLVPPAPKPAAPRMPEPRASAPEPRVSPPTAQTVVAPAMRSEPAETAEPRASAVSDSAIRVDVGLLDKLMNLVGELVLARNQIVQFSTAQEDAGFLGTVQHLNLLTTELQANVMKTRMQPIGNLWSKFPRIVRDLAVACGKQVRLEMDGQETELDKTIVEAIRDPLTHLVRNAVDHGIEPPAQRTAAGKAAEGRLSLHAAHEGGKVIIEIVDDGGGIDPQRVRAKAVDAKVITAELAERLGERDLLHLIFLPGFSTAERVTHFSGRGVGMDVVRTNVEKIGGTVDIESMPGRGTTVRMKIPLTLAIVPALTISSGGDRYAIPQVSLLELVRLEREQAQKGIEQIHGAPVYRLRGNLLPLVYLNRELQVDGPGPQRAGSDHGGAINIVVLQADDRQFGLIVDAIHDTEEIVVKPLQKQLKGIGAFAGATIMGDGKVALILDVLGLAQRAHVVSGERERVLNAKTTAAAEANADRQTVLLFAGADGGRMAIPLALVARLEEFPRSAIERVGSQEVVQYRDEIMPLIDVTRVLKRRRPERNGPLRKRRRGAATTANSATDKAADDAGDMVQVVVHAGTGQRVGLVVGRILDIVEETLVTRARANRAGVLFTAVVQGRVTEFVDVAGIIRSADPAFVDQASSVEPSPVAVEA